MDDHEAAQQAGAAVRFVVANRMPMLVIGMGDTPADDALYTRLAVAGLAPIPAFYGVNFPRGARIGFTLSFEHMRLEDEQAEGLLQVPRAAVDVDWLTEAKRLKGTMLAVGRDLDLDPDADDRAVCDQLDERARRATADNDAALEVRAAIVGVAEPRETLPLLF